MANRKRILVGSVVVCALIQFGCGEDSEPCGRAPLDTAPLDAAPLVTVVEPTGNATQDLANVQDAVNRSSVVVLDEGVFDFGTDDEAGTIQLDSDVIVTGFLDSEGDPLTIITNGAPAFYADNPDLSIAISNLQFGLDPSVSGSASAQGPEGAAIHIKQARTVVLANNVVKAVTPTRWDWIDHWLDVGIAFEIGEWTVDGTTQSFDFIWIESNRIDLGHYRDDDGDGRFERVDPNEAHFGPCDSNDTGCYSYGDCDGERGDCPDGFHGVMVWNVNGNALVSRNTISTTAGGMSFINIDSGDPAAPAHVRAVDNVLTSGPYSEANHGGFYYRGILTVQGFPVETDDGELLNGELVNGEFTISGNTIDVETPTGYGVGIWNFSTSVVENNWINVDNPCVDGLFELWWPGEFSGECKNAAIFLSTNWGNEIVDNIIEGSGDAGVFMVAADYNTFRDNDMSGHDGLAYSVDWWWWGADVVFTSNFNMIEGDDLTQETVWVCPEVLLPGESSAGCYCNQVNGEVWPPFDGETCGVD